MKRGSQEWEWR